MEFKDMFNNHPLSTERHRTPNQIWFEGMTDVENPLSRDIVEDDQNVNEFYGEDPQGPRGCGEQGR